MGAELSRRKILAGALAGVLGVAAVAAQAPESPYGGTLAKAFFLSERVGDAIGELARSGPPEGRAMLAAAAERAKQPEPALEPAAGANPVDVSRLAVRRRLAQGMVAAVAAPDARAASVEASNALTAPADAPRVEDAQGIGVPLDRAERAEAYLKANRDSVLAPYLYTYLMAQYRLAFERQAAAKALEGQKASAKKYRAFLLRAKAATDPLLKALADDVDAALFLQTPTPEHPRDFDPDACCRNR